MISQNNIKYNDILININDNSTYKVSNYFVRRLKIFNFDYISVFEYINDLNKKKLYRKNKKLHENLNIFRKSKLN